MVWTNSLRKPEGTQNSNYKLDPKEPFREVVTFEMSLKRWCHPLKESRGLFRGKEQGQWQGGVFAKSYFSEKCFFFGKMLFFSPDYLRTVELLMSLEPGWSQAFTGLSFQSFLTPAGVSAQWEPQTTAFKTTLVRQVSTWQTTDPAGVSPWL